MGAEGGQAGLDAGLEGDVERYRNDLAGVLRLEAGELIQGRGPAGCEDGVVACCEGEGERVADAARRAACYEDGGAG